MSHNLPLSLSLHSLSSSSPPPLLPLSLSHSTHSSSLPRISLSLPSLSSLSISLSISSPSPILAHLNHIPISSVYCPPDNHIHNFYYTFETPIKDGNVLSFILINPNFSSKPINFTIYSMVLTKHSHRSLLKSSIHHLPSPLPSISQIIPPPSTYIRHQSILLSSTQLPFQGGPSSSAYHLLSLLRSISSSPTLLSSLILFVNSDNPSDIDPENLSNIWQFNSNTIPLVQEYLESFSPDFIFAFDFLAPTLSNDIFKNSILIYFITSSFHCNLLAGEAISAQKFIKNPIANHFNDENITEIQTEIQSITRSDHVIPNSPLTSQIFKLIYPSFNGFLVDNPINTTVITLNHRLLSSPPSFPPFNSRQYDIMYIVTDTLRQIKNPKFTKELYKHPKLKKLKKLLIGNNITFFNNVPNLRQLPILSQNELFDYMKNTKIIIIPSFFDASPPIMFEAILNGCIPIISKNVGNHELLLPQLVCDDVYDKDDWISHIFNTINDGNIIQNQLPNIKEIYNSSITQFKSTFELNFDIPPL
jgi:hypothetical protein